MPNNNTMTNNNHNNQGLEKISKAIYLKVLSLVPKELHKRVYSPHGREPLDLGGNYFWFYSLNLPENEREFSIILDKNTHEFEINEISLKTQNPHELLSGIERLLKQGQKTERTDETEK